MRRLRVLIILTFTALLVTPFAYAEDSVRQCIRFAPSGERILIPAGQNVQVGYLDFHLNTASDAVFLNSFFWQDSATPPGSFVSYHMHVDGGDAYRLTPGVWSGMRTPLVTDGSQTFEVVNQNIPAGDHTATLIVINNSGTDYELGGFWMQALFTDSSQPASYDQRNYYQTISSSTWTTIGQITVPSTTNGHIVLTSFVRANNVGQVSFRYYAGSQFLKAYVMNFNNQRDGGVFNYILENATPGTTVTLRAKGGGVAELTEMVAQAVPAFTVFSGSAGGPIYIPNDWSLYTIAQSPPTYLNALSKPSPNPNNGLQDTVAWGFGHTGLSMSDSTESLLWLRLFKDSSSTPAFHDMGVMGHSPDPQWDQFRQIASWQSWGMDPNTPYHIEQSLQGLCSSGPSIQVHRTFFQVLVEPRIGSHVCVQGGGQFPNCAYSCGLSSVTTVPAPTINRCN